MSGTTDPLVALIVEYRAQVAAFNASAAQAEWGELTERTYGPLFDRLREQPPMPTSYAGALAGVEFVLDEMAHHSDSDANESVLRVCAAFLREHGARS